ncbi:MAG: NUDIX domain-containing protein [Thermoplasmata archaeon]|nr:NUDIX domain-containing protein [Candidatus Sysuiplasma jiujiangense]
MTDQADCAGLLLMTEDRRFLLVHRKDRDEWETPGGHIQDKEAPIEAAMRETFEEVGPIGYSDPKPFGPGNALLMTTGFYYLFTATAGEFTPTLSEHDAFQWVTAAHLPETTHPHTYDAIQSIAGDETAIAKSMSMGMFPSPQRIPNAWLFDLRVTGTGVSYRTSRNEWVFRPPEFYLCAEFLERCNGVPVMFDHPGKLDTEGWRNHAIGTLVYPYIPPDDEIHQSDEVWSIARIYDEDAAELMMTTHTSTSPGVSFGTDGTLKSVVNDDGSHLLIEGRPSHIDHLAVCKEGVWDKGDSPRGINN